MPAATPLRSLRKERCLIATDGKIHYRGPCTVAEWDKDETHITTVGRTPMIGAIIYTHQFSVWNGPEGESHLHGSLGDMRREGSCWITRAKPRFDVPTYSVRGRVCAR